MLASLGHLKTDLADSGSSRRPDGYVHNAAVNKLMKKVFKIDDNYPGNSDSMLLKAYRAPIS